VRLRVVHVASGREWRGGQRQVWLLARELQTHGLDQVVVTARRGELARRLSVCGVRVRSATWRAGLDPRVLPPILQELRRPALLHAHDAHALTLAGICATLTRSPLVVTRRVTFPLRRLFFWRRACRIITISRAVGQALVRDGIDRSRLVLIPSALEPAAPAADGAALRTRIGLPQKGQLAVSLGALTPEKDQSTLVSAAAELVQDLPDLHWLIVGDGSLKQSLHQQIVRLGVQNRVHLLGQLEDPHDALAGADVFVLSSVSEGLGSSVLAAMARGVPVVATRVGGIPDLLELGAGVLVEPRDPVQLAAAVRQVLGDADLRDSLTRNAHAALGKYSVDAMAEQVMSVYRSCAHSLDGS
jgi:L-malate glycosyltransferase